MHLEPGPPKLSEKLGPAYALHGRSTHDAMRVMRPLGKRKASAPGAKAATDRAKMVGWGGTVDLEPGKENGHVNNDRQAC